MEENNFKRLEREQAERFRKNTSRVEKNIKTNVSAFQFIGNMIDLYVTRAIGFLASNVSPDTDLEEDNVKGKYPNV